MTELIKLSLVPTKIAEKTGGKCPSYREVYSAVLDGAIPAHSVRSRWYISRPDLARVAAHFGLNIAETAA